MICEYCGMTYDVESEEIQETQSLSGEDEASEEEFEVSEFRCPQCGGYIYNTDASAVEDCSYCGASVVLTGKMKRERKPKYIIPFNVTKENCRNLYANMMRHAVYAPRELKNPKYLKEFRPMYMPYWLYDVSQAGSCTLKAKAVYNHANDHIEEKYNVQTDITAYYSGVPYDASSSLADDISIRLAPYNTKSMKPFRPAYLSGMCADLADVDHDIYKLDAKEFANDCSVKAYKDYWDFKNSHMEFVNMEKGLSSGLKTKVNSVNGALFPIWFMAYRNRNRVAYATVNGQNGKVVSDIPMDPKKFFLGSLIGTAILACIFIFLFTIRPSVLLPIASLIGTFVLALYCREMKEIQIKENPEEDRGYSSQNSLQRRMHIEQENRKIARKIKEKYTAKE